jgi:hypothetical protein
MTVLSSVMVCIYTSEVLTNERFKHVRSSINSTVMTIFTHHPNDSCFASWLLYSLQAPVLKAIVFITLDYISIRD